MTKLSKYDRLVRAYRPLQMRGSLVDGSYHRPPAPAAPPRRRMALLALAFGAVWRRGRS